MRALLLCLTITFSCLQSSFAQTAASLRTPYQVAVVRYGNIAGKSASVDELVAKPELAITVPAQPELSASFRITSFSVSAVHDGIYEELAVIAPNMHTQDTVMVYDPVTGQEIVRISDKINPKPGNSVTGNRLTPHQISRLSTLKSGDRVFFDDIRGVVPDGTTRHFGSIMLYVR